MVLRAVAVARRHGLDPAELGRRAGLDVAALAAEPDLRVPLAASDGLLERVADALGPAVPLGLELALEQDPEAYGIPGLLLCASASYGEGLRRALQYQRLWGDGERFQLHEAAAGLVVRYEPIGPPRPAHEVAAECALAEIVLGARLVTGGSVPTPVRLRHVAPARAAALARYFGRPPTFGAAANEVALGLEVASARPMNAHDGFARLFERLAAEACARIPTALPMVAARVRRAVLDAFPEGVPGLGAVARTLRMSARTLQRRLASERVSYERIVDAAREERAKALLLEGASTAAVAAALGFAEPSAFFRAFRRWTGQPPGAFQRAARAP
jgi:AraC-like DNA-binding protein